MWFMHSILSYLGFCSTTSVLLFFFKLCDCSYISGNSIVLRVPMAILGFIAFGLWVSSSSPTLSNSSKFLLTAVELFFGNIPSVRRWSYVYWVSKWSGFEWRLYDEPEAFLAFLDFLDFFDSWRCSIYSIYPTSPLFLLWSPIICY